MSQVNLTNTTDSLEELHDIVVMNDRVIGRASRREFLTNKKIMRRSAHIWLRNTDGKFWLQQRSATKDLQPNCWSYAVGGFVGAGASTKEEILEEAKRELSEELSIDTEITLFKILPMPDLSIGGIMVYWYIGQTDGPFVPNKVEISDFDAFDLQEVWALHQQNKINLVETFVRELSYYIEHPHCFDKLL